MSKLIAIDNGHGLNTAGKRTPTMPNGKVVHEWEFNHATAKKLDASLKRCGFRTLMVSDTSADTALQTRATRANAAGADAFCSIHYNANTGRWGTWGGIETLYSQGSSNGKKLADLVQKELISATGLRNRGAKARNNLWVLNQTRMPAILPECGFMDNKQEAALMLDNNYQNKVAEAITKGICAYFGVKYVSPSGTPSKPTPTPNKPSTGSSVYYGEKSPHNTKPAITQLQNDLISLGYSFGKWGADGSFGPTTKATVIKFQKDNGLKQDGLAGTSTLAKIQELKNKKKVSLYRIRSTWADASSQKGAYESLESAIEVCDQYKGYHVYDESGTQVYPKKAAPTPNETKYYRVRKSWADVQGQKGAFEELEGAITRAKANPGYKVYDHTGKIVYEEETETKPVPKPQPPIENKTSITGASIATAEQMAKILLEKNPKPKIFIPALEYCQLFLDEGHIENIKGDVAFCQAMKETGWLRFGGQVLPEQNNFSGIGATNNSPVGKGAWFKDAKEGIRAQIQHLKAYANTEPIVSKINVDPRFHLVKRGVAPNWTDLNGRWAVPGPTYGQDILKMHDELTKVKVVEPTKPVDNENNLVKLRNEISQLKQIIVENKKEIKNLEQKIASARNILG